MDSLTIRRIEPAAKLKCSGGSEYQPKGKYSAKIIPFSLSPVHEDCSCPIYSRIRRCSCCRHWFAIRRENLRIKAMMQKIAAEGA